MTLKCICGASDWERITKRVSDPEDILYQCKNCKRVVQGDLMFYNWEGTI